MWCGQINKQLSALVDGELEPADERRVRSHAEQCPRCAKELQQLRGVVQLARAIPEEAVPAGLYQRTMMRLAYVDQVPEPAVPFRARVTPPLWFWPVMAGAAMGALVVGLTSPPTPSVPGRQEQRTAEREPAPAAASIADPAPATGATPVRRTAPVAPSRANPPVQFARAAVDQHPASTPGSVSGHDGASVIPMTPVPPRRIARAAVRLRTFGAVPHLRGGRLTPTPAMDASASNVPSAATAPEATDMASATPMPSAPAGTGMPAEAVNVPAPEAVVTGDPGGMRMAGFTPDGGGSDADDEGIQALKSFLSERNRSVPQPPLVPMRDRRMQKPL